MGGGSQTAAVVAVPGSRPGERRPDVLRPPAPALGRVPVAFLPGPPQSRAPGRLAAHREHPLDTIYTVGLLNRPPFALGFPVEAIALFVAFRASGRSTSTRRSGCRSICCGCWSGPRNFTTDTTTGTGTPATTPICPAHGPPLRRLPMPGRRARTLRAESLQAGDEPGPSNLAAAAAIGGRTEGGRRLASRSGVGRFSPSGLRTGKVLWKPMGPGPGPRMPGSRPPAN